MMQNNLGNALRTLGQRESGTQRLIEAVEAFRDALKEWTRERVPLQWATTQTNLGNALWTLGESESGTEHLLEAVEAYRDALKEWTRARMPLQGAYSQHGLAEALARLAERQKDPALMQEALVCMRGAAEEYQRGGDDYWLSAALRRISEMEATMIELQRQSDQNRTSDRGNVGMPPSDPAKRG
jgi:tetratricopeptide (TPR) repeat protein